MEEDKGPQTEAKEPEDLVIYDPDNLPYEKRYLCVYLRELLDEAEKAAEELNSE